MMKFFKLALIVSIFAGSLSALAAVPAGGFKCRGNSPEQQQALKQLLTTRPVVEYFNHSWSFDQSGVLTIHSKSGFFNDTICVDGASEGGNPNTAACYPWSFDGSGPIGFWYTGSKIGLIRVIDKNAVQSPGVVLNCSTF
jgi:hypothetical protein